MGDATETHSRCRFWPSVYIFATYKGISALAHRQQTQTNLITVNQTWYLVTK